MPGVPKSSSCDACLKQKKKCDNAKPACSRCQRLQIPCVGAGVKRYKFMTVDGQRDKGITQLVVLPAVPPKSSGPALLPTNGSTRLATHFMHKLSVTDVRYDLCLNYGPLLREMPKRIGQSEALDSAITALVATMNDLETSRTSDKRLRQYGQALSSLRASLLSPRTAFSPLTLCAVLVVWICQAWLGGDQSNEPGHGAGVLQLLSASPLQNSHDPFEKQLVAAMLAPVMFEAAFDSSLGLEPWMQDILLGGQHGRTTARSCLLQLSQFMKYDVSQLPSISRHYEAMMEKYREADRVYETSVLKDSTSPRARFSIFSGLAMVSGIAVALNGIMAAYDPDNSQLTIESQVLLSRIIVLAQQSEQFLPLAASWMPISLEWAWVARTDDKSRRAIQATWEQYWTPVSKAPFAISSRFAGAFDELRSHAATGSGRASPPDSAS